MGRHIFWRIVIGAAMLFAGSWVAADTAVLRVAQDWRQGHITFELQEPLAPYLERGTWADAPYAANQKWRSDFVTIVRRVLAEVTINRDETLVARLLNQENRHTVMQDVVQLVVQSYSGLSSDFNHVRGSYDIKIYPDMLSLLMLPSSRRAVTVHPNWVASDDYSGIVIVAMRELPIHGTDTQGFARAMIFPTIYDTQLRTVMEAAMVDLDVVRRQGMVAYDSTYNTEEWVSRVGRNPLVTYAHSLHSTQGGDIIIDTGDANRILVRAANRKLIREGRVLIVINTIKSENILTIEYN